jgi:hypothetical protein
MLSSGITRTFLHCWDSLYARGAIAYDRDYLPLPIVSLGPVSCMEELAGEIMEARDLWPFPVALF